MNSLSPAYVAQNVSLAQKNSLALPGTAALFASITHLNQLQELSSFSVRRFVLGGGSNLVLQGDYDGLILKIALAGRALVKEDEHAWYVSGAAGENWHDFVLWTISEGWGGLENLALIPGTVGAAPIQNIGAYGLEIGEFLHSLTAFDMRLGELKTFTQEACRFAYRSSVFKQEGWHLEGRFVITNVVFRLPKIWQARLTYPELQQIVQERPPTSAQHSFSTTDIADAVIRVRQKKLPDPAQLPNAGSFFQNPQVSQKEAAHLKAHFSEMPMYPQADGRVKLAAGWLIEKAGWKGRSLGAVGMYEKQALVLINHNKATGAEVIALAKQIQKDVLQKFGVQLTPEPVFL